MGCGDYWVVMLGPQYRYSVVSELKRKGYPVENLVRTAQRPDVTTAARRDVERAKKNAAEAAFFSKR